VAPAVAEVVLVEEPFADAQTEIGKVDFMRIVPEPETARVGDAVFTAVDDEAGSPTCTPPSSSPSAGATSTSKGPAGGGDPGIPPS
jgi:hypothetical protein